MMSYEVKLEFFEGPLDLLLHLIKKQDMDIRDIRISEITEEYLAYISIMKDLNLEMAGEFLVMSSTLLLIKAKTLLPEEKPSGDADEGPDPRADLIQRLMEYQKFKEAASFLSKKQQEVGEIFYRNAVPTFPEQDHFLDATLFDLLDSFKIVLNRASDEVRELIYEEIPLERMVREILDMVDENGSMHFSKIFSFNRTRRELIVTFLALLELIRSKQVIARQSEMLGDIRIYRVRENGEVFSGALGEG